MSSGAKRLVQSLRGRSGSGSGDGGGGGGGGPRGGSRRSESRGSDGGGAGSTSATRLFHYDSGHELDEISVIARGAEDIATTPTTPYHMGGTAGPGTGQYKYDSGQTLYSMVPPLSASRITPSGGELLFLFFIYCISIGLIIKNCKYYVNPQVWDMLNTMMI